MHDVGEARTQASGKLRCNPQAGVGHIADHGFDPTRIKAGVIVPHITKGLFHAQTRVGYVTCAHQRRDARSGLRLEQTRDQLGAQATGAPGQKVVRTTHGAG